MLGKGRSGNGNHQISAAEAAASIREASFAALAEARLQLGDIKHAYLGLAGADRKTDYDILHPMIRGIGFTNYTLSGDPMIGLRAGTGRPYGVALICGTGTNAAGRNPQGQHYQCGGFDYMYGDFGGGGSLNIEVFRTVIRAWDGRESPTLLTAPLLSCSAMSGWMICTMTFLITASMCHLTLPACCSRQPPREILPR